MSVLRSILALSLSAVAAGAAEFDPWFGVLYEPNSNTVVLYRAIAGAGLDGR